jgi:hypothetical protein
MPNNKQPVNQSESDFGYCGFEIYLIFVFWNLRFILSKEASSGDIKPNMEIFRISKTDHCPVAVACGYIYNRHNRSAKCKSDRLCETIR